MNPTVDWHRTCSSSEPQRIFLPLELLSLFNPVTGVGGSCHGNPWAGQGCPGQCPCKWPSKEGGRALPTFQPDWQPPHLEVLEAVRGATLVCKSEQTLIWLPQEALVWGMVGTLCSHSSAGKETGNASRAGQP